MKISGFDKLTLLNYPDKVACTIFTSGNINYGKFIFKTFVQDL